MKNKHLRKRGRNVGGAGGGRNSGMKTRHSLQPSENNQPPSDHVLPVWSNCKQTRGLAEIGGSTNVTLRYGTDPAARVRRWS